MNKQVASADEAVALVGDGATIMMGGFGLCGIPEDFDPPKEVRAVQQVS